MYKVMRKILSDKGRIVIEKDAQADLTKILAFIGILTISENNL